MNVTTLGHSFEAYRSQVLNYERKLEEAKKYKALIDTEVYVIKKRIEEGDSTGDRYRDFVIVTDCEHYNPLKAHRYRALDQSMKGFSGQLALVITQHQVGFPPVLKRSRNLFFCGLLESEQLILGTRDASPKCRLPFLKYIREGNDLEHYDKLTGPLEENYEPFEIGTFLPHGASREELLPGFEEEKIAQVIFGDEAVNAWLSENRPGFSNYFNWCKATLSKANATVSA